MLDTGRYLITRADEASWVFDEPVIFLGEWCRLNHRKEIWSEMDSIVAAPFIYRYGSKNADIDYLHDIEKRLFDELSVSLNKIHDVQFDDRYWNVVIRPWLNRFTRVIFNRFHTLEATLRSYKINAMAVVEAGYGEITDTDYLSFAWSCEQSDFWNMVMYGKILNFLGMPVVADKKTSVSKQLGPGALAIKSRKRRLVSALKRSFSAIVAFLGRRNDAFIANTYLPRKEELRLQLSLGQIPQLWSAGNWARSRVEFAFRKDLSFNHENHTGFEAFIRMILPEMIPTCHLEGYQSLVKHSKKLPWPSTPSFIFTSNMFDDNELFKVWTAGKVNQNIPYFIGQHGNNYGTAYGSEYYPEQISCSRFITWGWKHNEKHIPAFNFKIAGVRVEPGRTKKGILLIERCMYQLYPQDSYYEFFCYLQDQLAFVSQLSADIRELLTVRLHRASSLYNYNEDDLWEQHFPGMNIDSGLKNIRTLTLESELVIHSYDSTGILETLALNIPTLAFWQDGFDHISAHAKPYYSLLQEAGIIHLSAQSAAAKLNEIAHDIQGWWERDNVQRACRVFCEQYSRTSKDPAVDLKNILLSARDEFVLNAG